MPVRLLLLAVLAVLGTGCPRRLDLPPPPPPDLARIDRLPPANGSLWHPELSTNYQFTDVRARFPGDLLTVLIQESATGKKNAATDTSAESSTSAKVNDFFGITTGMAAFLPKAFTPDAIINAETSRESKGEAETSRNDTLTGNVTVRVVAVDESGNLWVRGDKVVSVNSEDQHIVLTGVVRPEDIATDNTVLSTRVADARIDYYGRGVVSDKTGVPLVHRLLDWVWPF
jgi:flagellar L-ring protein precursor FlgH